MQRRRDSAGSRFSSLTQCPASSLHLEHQIEGGLVLQQARLVGVTEALLDQAEIKVRSYGIFDRIHEAATMGAVSHAHARSTTPMGTVFIHPLPDTSDGANLTA